MAKSKVTRNSSRGGAEDGHGSNQGTNHNLNGRMLQGEAVAFSENGEAANAPPPHGNGEPAPRAVSAPGKGQPSAELAEKIKDLVRLAQEQGYLTYNAINEA